MSFVYLARNAAAVVSIAALSVVCATAGHADPAADMARCAQLHSLWNKFNFAGRGSTSATNVEIATAYSECQKGNYASGISTLTKALERSKIAIPDVEAATAR